MTPTIEIAVFLLVDPRSHRAMRPNMNAPSPPSLLTPAEQEIWLVQHIPHRICAVLTWLKMDDRWAMAPGPEIKGDNFHVYCLCRSVQEGRHIAMRWLIEFVGIADRDKSGTPQRPRRMNPDEQVTISRFSKGGILFHIDKDSAAAVKLSKVWKGCTQASSHPTTGTNHPPIELEELAEALGLVIAHLETTVYAANRYDLWDVLRKQETRGPFVSLPEITP
jgi:hypothetical protein